ncbi:MAG: hypothetical protein IPO21_12330 [Bacteroidales bacterium]|nr:hypothetical protein [Bacteroidales bacterium]
MKILLVNLLIIVFFINVKSQNFADSLPYNRNTIEFELGTNLGLAFGSYNKYRDVRLALSPSINYYFLNKTSIGVSYRCIRNIEKVEVEDSNVKTYGYQNIDVFSAALRRYLFRSGKIVAEVIYSHGKVSKYGELFIGEAIYSNQTIGTIGFGIGFNHTFKSLFNTKQKFGFNVLYRAHYTMYGFNIRNNNVPYIFDGQIGLFYRM